MCITIASSMERRLWRCLLFMMLLSAVVHLSLASSMDLGEPVGMQLQDSSQEIQVKEEKRAGGGRGNSMRPGTPASGRNGRVDLPQQSPHFWGSIATSAVEREPSCAELRAMWRHTRRIIRHASSAAAAAASANGQSSMLAAHQLPSFVNTVEYAFAPKFLRFWYAQPRGRAGPRPMAKGASSATGDTLPVGRVLLTKTKSKRPPPNSLSLTSDTEYQVRKTAVH